MLILLNHLKYKVGVKFDFSIDVCKCFKRRQVY